MESEEKAERTRDPLHIPSTAHQDIRPLKDARRPLEFGVQNLGPAEAAMYVALTEHVSVWTPFPWVFDVEVVISDIAPLGDLAQRLGRLRRHAETTASATVRVKNAADRLRTTKVGAERRSAVREFLAALADLIICLLRFLVRTLLLLLSRSLARTGSADVPVWKPQPIDVSPQITPRGPNAAFPVNTYRGGRRRSALGNVVLAA
ncbi:hypothetical protein ACFC26_16500 [Kitasatospora purpeofusca]|uniref:hypothetical protein n=1 Tax=Kitasatospora purpeofusca TaxID=67352 RepID=UPI0035DB0BB0